MPEAANGVTALLADHDAQKPFRKADTPAFQGKFLVMMRKYAFCALVLKFSTSCKRALTHASAFSALPLAAIRFSQSFALTWLCEEWLLFGGEDGLKEDVMSLS